MKKPLLIFLILLTINPILLAQERDDQVNVLIKRDKAFYGGLTKWKIYHVNGETYESFSPAAAERYLINGELGYIRQREYTHLMIPANESQLIYVGSQYFFIEASPRSQLTIYLKGRAYELEICNGEADVVAGFITPDISLYNNEVTTFNLRGMDLCEEVQPELKGYKERQLTSTKR